MSLQPRVSVILPVRNRIGLLRRAVASVLGQTFKDLELIVVDDASDEGIETVVTSFGDPRMRYLRRPTAGGPGAARNDGIREARGGFLAFQDSDDQWLVTKLEHQVLALERAPADVVLCCCGYLIEHESGRPRYVSPGAESLSEIAVLTHFHFFPPMWLVRREALTRAGPFDESLPSREDWELAIRLSETGAFIGVGEPGVLKTTSVGSVSANLAAHITSLTRILERHSGRFEKHPAARAAHLRELGLLEFLFGEVRRGRSALLRSARAAPPGLSALTWWAATLAGRNVALAVMRMRQRRGELPGQGKP